VFVRGQSAPGDGGGGAFWWSGNLTSPVDDNINVIVPSGAVNGAWVRVFQSTAFGPIETVAAAATIDLGTYPTQNFQITGNGSISSFGSTAGEGSPNFLLTFLGTPTIVASSNIITPSGANYVAAANSAALVQYQGGGVWRLFPFGGSGGGSGGAQLFYGVAAGATNAWTVTIPALPTPANGQLFLIQFPATNSMAGPTLQPNGGTAYEIFDSNGANPIAIGALPLSALLEFDSGQFNLLNAPPAGSGPTVPIAATHAQMEAGTSTSTFATPEGVWLHPAFPKAWAIVRGQSSNGACTLVDSFNISGVTRTAAGAYAAQTAGLILTSGFASACPDITNSLYGEGSSASGTNPTFNVQFSNRGGGGTQDPGTFLIAVYGRTTNA
jgi:hypothetical protein